MKRSLEFKLCVSSGFKVLILVIFLFSGIRSNDPSQLVCLAAVAY